MGGSHIAVGLVKKDRIVAKKEKDFSEQEKKDIEKTIEEAVVAYIHEILKQEKIDLSEISKIGIASPRNE